MPTSVHFRVTWDGVPMTVSGVGPLVRSTEVIEHREGGEPSATQTLPGRTTFEPLVVERGITGDRRFEEWANLVMGVATAPTAFRKDVTIEVFDGAGERVVGFTVFRAWPSTYRALPAIDEAGTTTLTEVLVLHHDGWSRLDA